MNAVFQRPRVLVIGASFGGIVALQRLFRSLGTTLSCPTVVVQHFPQNAQMALNLLFDDIIPDVKEAEDKEALRKQTVYFAPPGYHLLVEKDFTFSLSLDVEVQFARPSIDVLFSSAARAYRNGVVGVVLTGANEDGADGCADIVSRGGVVLVQDPKTAESAVMPQAALDAAQGAVPLALEGIAERLRILFDS